MLKGSEELGSCGVRDGSTVQVVRRMRGGEKHKKKKSKAEKTSATSTKTPEQKFAEDVQSDRGPAVRECDEDAVIQMIEEWKEYRSIVEWVSEGNDIEMEQKV